MSEPFAVGDPEVVYRLTDCEVYALFFRAHDKEADALEEASRMEVMGAEQSLEQKRDEHFANCRAFGFSDEEAEVAWQEWLREQGA